ncbi:hypothetical protein KFE25_010538 [Diacronema lutheri]|uniref:Uncharacterized protein n=1 Tax=Diacronema lutheri TaxID=2081491 RepID=A0A8J5X5B0_DIALT|nr:hypothetical protein KFE25_010538 [Diacronema lutheri]
MDGCCDAYPADEVLASGFARSDVVRLITQSLYALGYHRSAELLEGESHVKLLSADVSEFRRGILDGRWDDAGARIPALGLESPEAACAVQFLILEHKYLELVDEQRFAPALDCLRAQLVPLGANPLKLRTLASFLLCAERRELHERCGWANIGASAGDVRIAARQRLLRALQALIPPSVLVPEGRLEALLLQAMAQQAALPAQALSASACDTAAHAPRPRWDLFQDAAPPCAHLASACVRVLEAHRDEAWCVAFCRGGSRLASAGKDGLAVIWSTPDGALAPDRRASSPQSTDGAASTIASGECDVVGGDEGARTAVESREVLHVLDGHSAPVCYLQWSPDDSQLLTCCTAGRICRWAAATGALERLYAQHEEAVQACAWLPDGRHFISGGLDKRLLLWALDGSVLQAWHGVRVTDLALARSSGQLIVLTADQRIRLFPILATHDGQPRLSTAAERSLPVARPVTSCALSSDARQLLVSTASDTVELWDLAQAAEASEPTVCYVGHRHARFVVRSAFGGHAERFVLSGSEDAQVYIWNRADGALLEVLAGHSGAVNAVAWSPTQHHVFASASDDHTIRIWAPKSRTDRSAKAQ